MDLRDSAVPFLSADALRAGITKGDLRSARYRQVFRGVHVGAGTEDSLELRARAALVLHPEGASVSHTTAAVLLGLPVDSDNDIHVTVPRAKDRRRRVGIANHVASTGSRRVRGVRVVAGVELFLQLAQMLSLVDLVVAGDAMIRKKLVTLQQLRDATANRLGEAGTLAKRAAELVRPEVDSPMETRLRLLLVFAGFPEPTINHKIRNHLGDVVLRFDLCYLELRLIIEYDGRGHRDSLDQWDTDIDRREWMDRNSWRLIVVVARDVYRRPGVLLERIATAMRDCGGEPPARFDPRWREYF